MFIRLSNLSIFPIENNAPFLQEIIQKVRSRKTCGTKCHSETIATGSVGLTEEPQEGRGQRVRLKAEREQRAVRHVH